MPLLGKVTEFAIAHLWRFLWRDGDQVPEPLALRRWQRRFAVITLCMAFVAAAGGCAIWRVARSRTLPDSSCGTAVTHDLGCVTQILSESDAGALGCFSAAARGCKAASIGLTEMGIDSGASYVFAIRPGGSPCQMTELSQSCGWTVGSLTSGPAAPSCPPAAPVSPSSRAGACRGCVLPRCGRSDHW